jgi:hypothetical protein
MPIQAEQTIGLVEVVWHRRWALGRIWEKDNQEGTKSMVEREDKAVEDRHNWTFQGMKMKIGV